MNGESSQEQWVEQAERALAAAGRKRGGARRAVLELLGSQHCALTAVEIEDVLRGRSPRRVSRASVYRILQDLEGLGLAAGRDGAGDGAL